MLIHTLLKVVLSLPALTPAAMAGVAETPVRSHYISELPVHDINALLPTLRAHGITTVSTPIAWSVTEQQPGHLDASLYWPALDRLYREGFGLILTLDGSGRELLDQRGVGTGLSALPAWVEKLAPQARDQDFYGQNAAGLNYADPEHLRLMQDWYRRLLPQIVQRYGPALVGVMPGFTAEFEVKYPQHGYRWSGYSTGAQQRFADWLAARRLPAGPAPVIDYNNSLAGGLPRHEPLFPAWMRFREELLRDYACALTATIRAAGAPALGYFGQIFSSHDAIYATGILERVRDCFDVVAVDYNFYNGYTAEANPHVVPLLARYAHSLGYRRVLGGLYVERLRGADGRFDRRYLRLLNQTLAGLDRLPSLAGVEVGNLLHDEWDVLGALAMPRPALQPQPVSSRPRLGLVASTQTFYLWHGEHSNGRNLIEDALYAAFAALRASGCCEIEVLGETALTDPQLHERLDALVFAHQTTLSAEARAAVRAFHARGGRLVQDMRLDEFDADGTPRSGWMDDLFCLGGRRWQHSDGRFVYRGQRLTLPRQPRAYVSHALLAGCKVGMPAFNQPELGLLVHGPRTLTFGFLPQLVEDRQRGSFWQELYVREIVALLSETGQAR